MSSDGGGNDGGNWRLGWNARTLLLIVILVVFLACNLADIIMPGYDPPAWLSPLILGLVGVWFGVDLVRKAGPK